MNCETDNDCGGRGKCVDWGDGDGMRCRDCAAKYTGDNCESMLIKTSRSGLFPITII